MNSAYDPGGAGEVSVLSQHDYTYDGVGNRDTHTELIAGTTMPYKYIYDPLDRLTEVRNNTTNDLVEAYTYDPLGNRLTKTDATTTVAYAYDAANQLTQVCLARCRGRGELSGTNYDKLRKLL